ncbi:LutC/YkgG family protein [Marinobacter sp. JSM 1782161]|uniref:LutC/YkgG family protein n=1 Tax=Marinobacter sp. JSM 1782161 TaxID=2685906 RepID=UPI0014028C12|nr:LUD domain-containing protein [Marinobacter sp. JSM 1782161]
MKSRDRILARLRHGRTASPAAPMTPPESPPATVTQPDLEAMIEALGAAHAEVIRIEESQWPDRLAAMAAERSWQHWWVGRDEVAQTWQQHASAPQVTVFDDWTTQKDALFREAPVALSLAQGGIAETGTLIVESRPETPRTLSLVPPVHVVVVRERTVYPDMAKALANYSHSGLPTNLIFISGPSKTADIQQTLAYGAHGPKELIVFLCR